MAGRLLASCVRYTVPTQSRGMSYALAVEKIGSREVVGFGCNSESSYIDRTDYPMPAIRFMENTPHIMALREKEKGDWKKLSIEEKKALYRASFCQTFTEMDAPTGDTKGCIGVALMGTALALWVFMFLKIFAYPPLPITFDREHQLAQLERMKLLGINPISGISAQK